MLPKLRAAAGKTVMLAIEVVGCVAMASGAAVAVFFGKLFAAGLLGALALGVFLRLAARRGVPAAASPPTAPWVQAVTVLLALVEVAALTEATNLPVRHTQPDFEKINWVLVGLAFLALYVVQARFFRAMLARCKGGAVPSRR